MYHKKLIRKPRIETLQDLQEFLFKCSIAVALLVIGLFTAFLH